MNAVYVMVQELSMIVVAMIVETMEYVLHMMKFKRFFPPTVQPTAIHKEGLTKEI